MTPNPHNHAPYLVCPKKRQTSSRGTFITHFFAQHIGSPHEVRVWITWQQPRTHFSLDTLRRWFHIYPCMELDLACLETLQLVPKDPCHPHALLALPPKSIASSGCRVVYMCREPKDAFVSRWHFDNKIYRGHNMDLDASFTPSASTPKAFRPTVHFGTTILSIGRRAYVANPDNQGSLPQVLRGHDLRACQACCKASLQCSLVSHSASRSKEMGYQRRWWACVASTSFSSLPVNREGDFVRRSNLVLENSDEKKLQKRYFDVWFHRLKFSNYHIKRLVSNY